MKPRHAAALALVGWYLMAPPTSANRVWAQAPLAQWKILRSYDSASECQNYSLGGFTIWREVANRNFPSKDETFYEVFGEEVLSTVCVSTDDPRLKGR